MTSKDALEELRKMNPQTTITNTLLIERYLDLCKEIVSKDLEVLEILRKYIKNKVDWNKHILKIYETTIYAYDVDDFNKIKEWLQNDK